MTPIIAVIQIFFSPLYLKFFKQVLYHQWQYLIYHHISNLFQETTLNHPLSNQHYLNYLIYYLNYCYFHIYYQRFSSIVAQYIHFLRNYFLLLHHLQILILHQIHHQINYSFYLISLHNWCDVRFFQFIYRNSYQNPLNIVSFFIHFEVIIITPIFLNLQIHSIWLLIHQFVHLKLNYVARNYYSLQSLNS